MPVEVVTTDEFAQWYEALVENEREAVAHLVGLVEQLGVSLRFPVSSAIEGSNYPLRELRKRGRPIRIAEKLWQQYLGEQAAGLHDEEE